MNSVNPKVIQLLNDQAEMEYRASQIAFGLVIWTKRENWLGSHKALGRFRQGQIKRVKGIQKLLSDYFEQEVYIPPLPECACQATGLMDAYQQIKNCVTESQNGWQAIVNEAETDGSLGEIESYADRFLDQNIKTIKRLTRRLRLLSKITGDMAALLKFDREMKGKDI